ncbi:2-oxoglutarate and iron-dependent oxygenase domain-containing protein 3-like [Dreissena polymorpha]|uniref:Fe2OG dioxygenase domain-containing protein n=1 Tax=Dreissena polymorpha TaxID=45954 RepID=A0A9D4RCV8_DREPO|nr:2-oxoglutarate and iron-dependent oxygenase domain-containing protein 3-like [Dreissena polymorpha]KAH3863731.1 hypothetical protein DPMN_026729 [Dreissena polymorpha]
MSEVKRRDKNSKKPKGSSISRPDDERQNHTEFRLKTHWKYIAYVLTVVFTAAAIYLKVVYTEPRVATFAHADRQYQKQHVTIVCSDDYKRDTFTECKPKFCGRVVMDGIVTSEEVDHLLGVAKMGLSYGGSNGGASILDLHSGALSKGDKFISIYSAFPGGEGFKEEDFKIYRTVKNKIQQAIGDHFKVPLHALHLTKPTFFSRMNTSEAKNIHDEYWHPHVDRQTYGSFHYTSLLYLSTFNKDFTGGRFIFTDNGTETAVEPRAGRVSFFTSGSENVHFVEKLKSGVRYAITVSFTCDPEKAISDPDVV